MHRSRSLLLRAAALSAGACLDDAPLGPPAREARLAVAASVSAGGVSLAPFALEVIVSYRGPVQTETSPVLLHVRVPLADATARSVELPVDIGPCLRDTLRAVPGPACETWIDYRLTDDTGFVVDQQYTGPWTLEPGRRTTPDPVTLTVGTSVPVLDSVRAVLVDPSIVRYVPAGSDIDGNLRSFWATYTDSTVYDFSEHLLPGLVPSFQGPIYAFLATPAQGSPTATLSVQAVDSKYATSPALAVVPVVPDTSAPIIDVTGGLIVDDRTARVDFWISDNAGDAEAVEVLFRDPGLALTDPASDALLARCVRPLSVGTTPTPVFTSVTCGVVLPKSSVEVIVIPTQKNLVVGRAGRTTISAASVPAALR